jgi:uncharacterized membrane protein YgdD (TMEM256/DUF423 family)
MKKYLYLTSTAGVLGVSAGAFGAHALKDILTEAGALSTWNTGTLYHLIHLPALLTAALFTSTQTSANPWLAKACQCWLIGILLFSGSLYALALGGPRWLGPVTPLGGLFLISGWVCVIRFSTKRAQKA